MKNAFDICYIMFPENPNESMNIYECIPEIISEKKFSEYTAYILKACNCEFNIFIFDDKNKIDSLNSSHFKTAYMDDKEVKIIFAFNKESILKYYESKLHEISDILDIRKKQLEDSIKSINNQKEILYNNPEKLFIKY